MLGIDVSKATLAVCLQTTAADPAQELAREFPNTPAGHQALERWLMRHEAASVHACMEATGPYTLSLAQFLFSRNHPVSVVNPRRIQAYGHSRLSRVKTDRADAKLIANFARSEVLPLWTPPDPDRAQLRALQQRIDRLNRQIAWERNQLESATAEVVRDSVQRVCALLAEEVTRLGQDREALLQRHDALRTQVTLLCTIPGIGLLTATRLVASVDIQRFERAASFAAFLGLTPKEHSSGTSVQQRTRLSKMGSCTLRTALYFPAMQACRFNPQIKALYQRLLASGHSKKSAICAGMRKLAHQIYGVLKSDRPYDPTLGLPA